MSESCGVSYHEACEVAKTELRMANNQVPSYRQHIDGHCASTDLEYYCGRAEFSSHRKQSTPWAVQWSWGEA